LVRRFQDVVVTSPALPMTRGLDPGRLGEEAKISPAANASSAATTAKG
jgi:hypothetical protein